MADSPAPATAIASGALIIFARIGMDAAGSRKLESVAEVAHRNGKRVGIVTSVTMDHATPAGFYSHRPSRSQHYGISKELIASGF